MVDESHDVSAVFPEHPASEDNDRVGSGKDGRSQRAQAGDIQCFDRASSSQTQRRGGSFDSLNISFWARIWRAAPQHTDRADLREGRFQQLQPLSVELGRHQSEAGDVAARPRKTGCEALPHGIEQGRDNDRKPTARNVNGAGTGYDDLDWQIGQFCRQSRKL